MTTATRPRLLTFLALLLAIEALGVSGYTLWYGTQLLVAEAGTLAGAVFLFVLFIAMSVWAWTLAAGVFRMRTWSRAGSLVWQTILVVIGVSMINAEGDWIIVAIAMIALGALGGVLLFTPKVSQAIARQPRS